MDEKNYSEEGIKNVCFNDFFLKRLFKTKSKYFREGIIICGNYFSKVISECIRNTQNIKEELEREKAEKDCIINKLKERYNKIKNKSNDNERENDENKDEFVDDLISDIINVANKEAELYNDLQLIVEKGSKDEISYHKMLGRFF